MKPKREQALVGIFVIIASALLVITVLAVSGTMGHSTRSYHAYFPFAGGLEPGATVRYAGGPKVGRVERLQIDPQNPALINVTFSIQTDVPVKTDSRVKILSTSPLADNHLEILAGSPQAPDAPAGSTLPSINYLDFSDLTEQVSNLAPDAQKLLRTVNDRATELKETMNRVNDLLNAQNRENLAATMTQVRGMVEEDRPKIRATLSQVQSGTERLRPLLENFQKTSDQASQTLSHLDATVGENRADIRTAITEMRQALATLQSLATQLDSTMTVNSENIDELLDNLRDISENLNQFSDTIKSRPYTLIRSSNPPDRKPGSQP
jgi:phospholipid/cholesterol/gamma-HCH transport system substrate-binding protein